MHSTSQEDEESSVPEADEETTKVQKFRFSAVPLVLNSQAERESHMDLVRGAYGPARLKIEMTMRIAALGV